MPHVKTPVNELSYRTRFEIEVALKCTAGRKLKLKSTCRCPDYSDELSEDLDRLKSAYKEFTGWEMNMESLKEIFLSE